MHYLSKVNILCCVALIWIILNISTAFAQTGDRLRVNIETLQGRKLALYDSYRALVVGVEHYDHWPAKPDAVQDARDVSWALKRMGFSVRLLTDATSNRLRTALSQLAKETDRADGLGIVFYFAGHSYHRTLDNGQRVSWIVPKDVPLPDKNPLGFEKEAVSASEMAAMTGQSRAKHILLIIDAPFSSNLFQVEQPVLKMITDAQLNPARQFITTGSSTSATNERSQLKQFFLQALQGEADLLHDGLVSGSEIGLYLQYRISKTTEERLQPQFGQIIDTGDRGGDFVFRLTDQQLQVARLFIESQPNNATIRIMNIVPPFEQGMELKPGAYDLNISAEGYQQWRQSIQLKADEDRTLRVALKKIQDDYTNSLGMRFVRLKPKPEGYMMGSPKNERGRSNDEKQHKVQLTRFIFMQQTEVTMGQYQQFVTSTGYKTDAEKGGGCWIAGASRGWSHQSGSNWRKPGRTVLDEGLPAICITWNDAVAFARWLSTQEGRKYRLPTEAEWEYACRAGTTTPFSFGHCLSSREDNYAGVGPSYKLCTTVFQEKRGHPVPTGTLAPNPWELHNMHGNVAEWCSDWYGPYPDKSVRNPQGQPEGTERVFRGGYWHADAAKCRSAYRGRFLPNFASDVVGFRLVLMP